MRSGSPLLAVVRVIGVGQCESPHRWAGPWRWRHRVGTVAAGDTQHRSVSLGTVGEMVVKDAAFRVAFGENPFRRETRNVSRVGGAVCVVGVVGVGVGGAVVSSVSSPNLSMTSASVHHSRPPESIEVRATNSSSVMRANRNCARSGIAPSFPATGPVISGRGQFAGGTGRLCVRPKRCAPVRTAPRTQRPDVDGIPQHEEAGYLAGATVETFRVKCDRVLRARCGCCGGNVDGSGGPCRRHRWSGPRRRSPQLHKRRTLPSARTWLPDRSPGAWRPCSDARSSQLSGSLRKAPRSVTRSCQQNSAPDAWAIAIPVCASATSGPRPIKRSEYNHGLD